MRTLITGGKSSQALKLLKAFTGTQVLLADYGEQPAFSTSQYQFISLGEQNPDTIAHNLLNSCLDHEADQLIPLYDFELEAVAKSTVLFEEFNIQVLLPSQAEFSKFPVKAVPNHTSFVVYHQGTLIFSSDHSVGAPDVSEKLNGVFYMESTPAGVIYSLYHIK